MKKSTQVLGSAAAVYLGCGIVFGYLSAHADSHRMALVWRWSAWLVSALAFSWQIVVERRRLANSSRATALHAALASALGACGLAGLAIYHSLSTGQRPPALLVFSLVLWPVIVFVPAFFVALAAASVVSAHPSGA